MTYLIFCYILIFPINVSALDVFHVKHVIDGDTIILENNRHVRYIGIDAPEIYHKENRAQAFGYAARDYNQRKIGNKKIYLSYDREKKDAYNRLLAYVFDRDKNFINRLLLLEGYAYYLYKSPNIRFHDVLLKAQRAAMTAKRGLWGQLNDQDNVFIGNVNTKRFHTPSCPFGKRIRKINRTEFTGKWEAFWEGYAPCKRCMSVTPFAR